MSINEIMEKRRVVFNLPGKEQSNLSTSVQKAQAGGVLAWSGYAVVWAAEELEQEEASFSILPTS